MQMMKPDNTAVRTALWRALHVLTDAKPYVLEDLVGLQLVAPEPGWDQRPEMKYTKRLRASMVARARFIEDLIIDRSRQGVAQYVILGAGLDTFAQRQPILATGLQIYEIDQPGTLEWKRQRLVELGFGVPPHLHFVPVDFETASWWDALLGAGFDSGMPAVIACTGVTLYLTKEAIVSMLAQVSAFAPGSTAAIAFYLPMALLDEEDRPMQELAEKGARAAGTPFVSFFAPEEVLAMAQEAGLSGAEIVSTKELVRRYFAGRTDGLMPASGEVFLVAGL